MTTSRTAERETRPDPRTDPEPVVPVPRRRRRPVWVAAAVVLVALGALVAWFVVASLRDTTQVIALRHDVPRGAVIGAEDLVIAEIPPDPVLVAVSATQLAEVAGRRAAVDLSAGGLLSPAALVDSVTPAPGESVVGLALGPGQLPVTPLLNGDRVRIVSTPRDQDDPPASVPAVSIPATVVTTSASDVTAAVLVDVVVSESDGALLAGLVATGRVALILDSAAR